MWYINIYQTLMGNFSWTWGDGNVKGTDSFYTESSDLIISTPFSWVNILVYWREELDKHLVEGDL